MFFRFGVLKTSLSFAISLVTSLVSLLAIFFFSMYQMFLIKKCEYQHRLLNVLYFQFAVLAQIGSFLNLVIIVIFFQFGIESGIYQSVLSILKLFQVTCVLLTATLTGMFFFRTLCSIRT